MTARQMLTIPEICADLKVTEAEWNQWRAEGKTPLHVIGADGEPRVRAGHFRAWFESLRTGSTPEPPPRRLRPARPWDILTAPLSPEEKAKADAENAPGRGRRPRPWDALTAPAPASREPAEHEPEP